MRVAIDARKIHDFGIGTYTRNLLRHLARIDRDNEYVLLCSEADLDVAGQLGPNFRTVLEPSPNYSFREQFHVPWVLRRVRPDVFHAPHYVLPPAVRCKSVVTIHDCIHLMFPQYLPNRAAYAYAKGSMWSAAHRSDRILTVSEASKRDILHFFNVPPEKIVVVYNAIDERFRIAPAQEDVARVRERYRLDHRFVLYAGNIKPHKNLVRLIEAFADLRTGQFEELKSGSPPIGFTNDHITTPLQRVVFINMHPELGDVHDHMITLQINGHPPATLHIDKQLPDPFLNRNGQLSQCGLPGDPCCFQSVPELESADGGFKRIVIHPATIRCREITKNVQYFTE